MRMCVCQDINSIHAQTARFNIPTSYVLRRLQTMCSEFHALQVRSEGMLSIVCTPCLQHTAAPALRSRPRRTKTHIACSCALLLPTSLRMHPSEGEEGFLGARRSPAQHQMVKKLGLDYIQRQRAGMDLISYKPFPHPEAVNHCASGWSAGEAGRTWTHAPLMSSRM